MSYLLSPHHSALDPQSPFPCTPSTLGGSSPPSGGTGGGQYFSSFRTSASALGNSRLGAYNSRLGAYNSVPTRHVKQDSVTASTVRGESPLPSSAKSSPRTPASDSSPSMPGSVDASPDSAAAALPGSSTSGPGMRTHPSTASIPIILAGLGMLEGLGMQGVESPEKAVSGQCVKAYSMLKDTDGTATSPGRRRSASIGLGILQAPLDISQGLRPPLSPLTETSESEGGDTSASSLGTLRDLYADPDSTAIVPAADSSPEGHGSAASSRASTLAEDERQREDRIGSWTSSLLSVGGSVSSSTDTASTLPTPEPSPRGNRFGQSQAAPPFIPKILAAELPIRRESLRASFDLRKEVEQELEEAFAESPILRQREAERRTMSAQSDFSVSAYNYSPYIGGKSPTLMDGKPSPQLGRARSRWCLQNGENKVQLLGLGLPSRQSSGEQPPRERQVSAVLSTTSSKGDGSGLARVKEKVKSRKRAATISNGTPEGKTSDVVAAHSSHKQQAGFATLTARQRALFAADYKLYPVSPTNVLLTLDSLSRPSTAGSPTSSIFKPLPAIPSPYTAPPGRADRPRTAGSSRPGTGRKASSANLRGGSASRPGTAGTVAKAFGLVATPPLGFGDFMRGSWTASEREYQSVHSEDSTESATDAQPSRSDPPPEIIIMIDQENFRNIEPGFRLSLPESTADKVVYEAAQANKGYPYHYAPMDPAPILRCVLNDQRIPVTTREAYLPIKQNGMYSVEGTEGKAGTLRWKFVYLVCNRTSLVGRGLPGEKNIVPVSFTCSSQLFNPAVLLKQKKVLTSMYKAIVPRYEASRIGELPPDFVEERG